MSAAKVSGEPILTYAQGARAAAGLDRGQICGADSCFHRILRTGLL